MSFATLLSSLVIALPCGQNRAFVDLGANDGQSLKWFGKNWAPKAPSKFTAVYAFEMNPAFAPALQQLVKPWNGELVPAAAWTVDGSMTANMQMPGSRVGSKHGMVYNMTSSSLEVGGTALNKLVKSSQRSKVNPAHERRVSVRTVDFAKWLEERFCKADHIDVKMDIEGAEFEVLEHLLRSGRASLIDTIAVEWHTQKRGQGGARTALLKRQEEINARLRREGVKLVVWTLR